MVLSLSGFALGIGAASFWFSQKTKRYRGKPDPCGNALELIINLIFSFFYLSLHESIHIKYV
jgi:hypothetical protein